MAGRIYFPVTSFFLCNSTYSTVLKPWKRFVLSWLINFPFYLLCLWIENCAYTTAHAAFSFDLLLERRGARISNIPFLTTLFNKVARNCQKKVSHPKNATTPLGATCLHNHQKFWQLLLRQKVLCGPPVRCHHFNKITYLPAKSIEQSMKKKKFFWSTHCQSKTKMHLIENIKVFPKRSKYYLRCLSLVEWMTLVPSPNLYSTSWFKSLINLHFSAAACPHNV